MEVQAGVTSSVRPVETLRVFQTRTPSLIRMNSMDLFLKIGESPSLTSNLKRPVQGDAPRPDAERSLFTDMDKPTNAWDVLGGLIQIWQNQTRSQDEQTHTGRPGPHNPSTLSVQPIAERRTTVRPAVRQRRIVFRDVRSHKPADSWRR